jgi:putative peptide zinc metalloprotease protein
MATYFSLRPGCTLHPFDNGSGIEEFVVQTPDNRHFKISAPSRLLLERLDSGVSLEDIYSEMATRQPDLTWAVLYTLIQDCYSQLLVARSGQVACLGAGTKQPLRFIVSRQLVPQAWVVPVSRLAAHLYQPIVAILLLSATIIAHVWLYRFCGSIAWVHGHVAVVLLATLLSVIVHEVGHASAVARFGGKPGGIGIGLYILLPVFYADVSQLWTFPRGQRAVVDMGGIYFQQICFLPFAAAAMLTHSLSFRATCIGIDIMTLIAINPAFRFDGYWLLVDWLGIPRLHQEAAEYLKRLIFHLLRFKKAQLSLRQPHLNRLQATMFVLYGVAGNLLILGTIALNLRWISSTLAGLRKEVPLLASHTVEALQGHQWLNAADFTVSLIFACTSGATLLIAFSVRGRQVWGAISSKVSSRGQVYLSPPNRGPHL